MAHDELLRTVRALQREVDALRAGVERSSSPSDADADEAMAAFELESEGFQRIRWIPSRHETGDDGARRLSVEAVRAGGVYKGRVTVREGSITSIDLKPSFQAFP